MSLTEWEVELLAFLEREEREREGRCTHCRQSRETKTVMFRSDVTGRIEISLCDECAEVVVPELRVFAEELNGDEEG